MSANPFTLHEQGPRKTILTATRPRPMSCRRMTYSRLIGGLFLAGFITYGVGSSLVRSVVGEESFLSLVPAREATLALGVFLMLLNTVVDIGKAVLFFPVAD